MYRSPMLPPTVIVPCGRMQHRPRMNGEQAVLPEGEIADVRKIIEELWLEVFGRAA